jgi:hypothetical protein
MDSCSMWNVSFGTVTFGFKLLLCDSNPFFELPHRWFKELDIDYETGKVDCSNVIMSNGRGHVLGKNRCGLCGRRGGLKARCCTEGCRGHGETRSPYFFHVTCARQAGYEVNHSEDPELLFYGTSSELNASIISFLCF